MASLGLGKLRALHSNSYFMGIGVPTFLYLFSLFMLDSLDQVVPILYAAGALVLLFFFFEHYYAKFKYMNCPICGSYIRVRTDWLCGHCDSRQGEERLLIEPCRHCGQRVEKISCGGCREDLRL